MAAAVAFAGCSEDPFDPWTVTASGDWIRPGASVNVYVEDACTFEERDSFDRFECEDNFMRSITFDSSGAFRVIDVADDDGAWDFPGQGVLEFSFAVRAIGVTDELCVEINGYDDECDPIRVREPDQARLDPMCSSATEAPHIIPAGIELRVDVAAYWQGQRLTGGDPLSVDVDPGPFESVGNGVYRAPDTPGTAVMTELFSGNELVFDVVDPVAAGWRLVTEVEGVSRVLVELDAGGAQPCKELPIVATVLTPAACEFAVGGAGPTEVTAGSIDVSRTSPSACIIELEMLTPGGAGILGTNVELDGAHTLFVSSAQVDGNLGGLAGGDLLCADLAATAGRPEPAWKALLSDETGDAADRITLDAPIFDVNGEVLYSDPAQVWAASPSKAPVFLTENGDDVTGDYVWTGTQVDGTAGSDCENWSTGSLLDYAVIGEAGATDEDWIDSGALLCSGDRRLYCISQ